MVDVTLAKEDFLEMMGLAVVTVVVVGFLNVELNVFDLNVVT